MGESRPWMSCTLVVSLVVALALVGVRVACDDLFDLEHEAETVLPPTTDVDAYVQNAEGLWLFTRTWLPEEAPRALVYLIHGYGEHSGRRGYALLAKELTARGYVVCAHDHQGHGRSSGTRGHAKDFQDLVDDTWMLIKRRQAEMEDLYSVKLRTVVFAHSLGGIVATRVSMQHQGIAGVAYSGTALQVDPDLVTPTMRFLGATVAKYVPKLTVHSIPLDSLPEDRGEDDLVFEHFLAQFSLSFLRTCEDIIANVADITNPIMLFHGKQDVLAEVSGSYTLFNGASSDIKSIHILENAKHELLETEYLDTIVEKIDGFYQTVIEL